jgi:hypothetical protein
VACAVGLANTSQDEWGAGSISDWEDDVAQTAVGGLLEKTRAPRGAVPVWIEPWDLSALYIVIAL